MSSRSESMNRSSGAESDQEHDQDGVNYTDHSVVTTRGAPARRSRRERSEVEESVNLETLTLVMISKL
ncbi:hypothetical protein PENVUL_c002G03373 [Penicillium vulpinum]|uniref:Uncharacterized protein n=1 Tax=Penicillium vulpinum TaxID=29845 RepID=A0A1V6SCP2_9EURO|nr:hypothetical protein PENVUL_c002G03373 [Penicillium vulpinum]